MRRRALGGLSALATTLATAVAASLAMAGAAMAHDFIVVNSTDPALHAGQPLDAGAHLALAPGRTLTVIRISGEVTTLHGAAGGVSLPALQTASADSGRFDALHALFQAPPAGRTFGARRGFCPAAEALTTLDSIIQANRTGCGREARAAFQAYLKTSGAPGADAIYDTPQPQ